MVLMPTQRLQAMTKNIQLENLALKLVAPEASRLLKADVSVATGFPEARKIRKRYKRVPGINSSPHSVSGKDIIRLAVFRPSKPGFS